MKLLLITLTTLASISSAMGDICRMNLELSGGTELNNKAFESNVRELIRDISAQNGIEITDEPQDSKLNVKYSIVYASGITTNSRGVLTADGADVRALAYVTSSASPTTQESQTSEWKYASRTLLFVPITLHSAVNKSIKKALKSIVCPI